MTERREAILKYIEEKGEISIGELASHFASWSEMTLRRDLAALEQMHKIILTRGGARSIPSRYGLHEDIYSAREQRNDDAKQLIAAKAVEEKIKGVCNRVVKTAEGKHDDGEHYANGGGQALARCVRVFRCALRGDGQKLSQRSRLCPRCFLHTQDRRP